MFSRISNSTNCDTLQYSQAIKSLLTLLHTLFLTTTRTKFELRLHFSASINGIQRIQKYGWYCDNMTMRGALERCKCSSQFWTINSALGQTRSLLLDKIFLWSLKMY